MRLYTGFDKDISHYKKTFTRYSNHLFNNESGKEARVKNHVARGSKDRMQPDRESKTVMA